MAPKEIIGNISSANGPEYIRPSKKNLRIPLFALSSVSCKNMKQPIRP